MWNYTKPGALKYETRVSIVCSLEMEHDLWQNTIWVVEDTKIIRKSYGKQIIIVVAVI